MSHDPRQFHPADNSAGAPPQLMIRANFPLTPKNSELINDQVEEALRYGKPLVLDSRFEVAQLVRGVWLPVFASDLAHGDDDKAAETPAGSPDGGEVDPRPV
jgi:hypothetical protein